MRYALIRPIAFFALGVLTGCASQSPRAAAPPPAQAPEYPVIVRLVSRAQTVTISAGPECPLYSVRSADGKTLVSLATLDELRTQHPDQFRWIQPLVATDTAVIADAARE